MEPTKEKISASIESVLARILEDDARATAKITFGDLPSEDEWTELQPNW